MRESAPGDPHYSRSASIPISLFFSCRQIWDAPAKSTLRLAPAEREHRADAEGGSGLGSARRPVIDSVKGGISETCLKLIRIFPQVVQQPGQLGFGGKPIRRGKSLPQVCDLAEMHMQWLPLARGLGQWFAKSIICSVRVKLHQQAKSFSPSRLRVL